MPCPTTPDEEIVACNSANGTIADRSRWSLRPSRGHQVEHPQLNHNSVIDADKSPSINGKLGSVLA